MRRFHLSVGARRALLLAGAWLVLAWSPTGEAAVSGGTFRYLTVDFPRASTNSEYTVRLLTANARGPVTYSSNPATPAPGLGLDPQTGLITGIPTVVNSSGSDVTFFADDGDTVIQLATKIRVNASGGGGNSGASFVTTSLPAGRVGEAYAAAIVLQNTVGPEIIYGAADLPLGLSLNGLTGAISGTPQAAGAFYATLSATDRGENDNKVFTIVPIEIRPAASEFRFVTSILNNGEVGTLYGDLWTTTDASGPVSYSASGLPDGVTVTEATGDVAGTPTVGGLFQVSLTATDSGGTITTNRPMWIAPSAASSFHWDFTGLPTGIIDIPYGRQPPILVSTTNGGTVVHSATGVPVGMTYDASSGELSGTPTEVGVHPVVFTATDTDSGEVIQLSTDIVVLPPSGGDAGSLAVNLWVKVQQLKPNVPGKGLWKATYIYNADRTAANAFDPATLGSTFSLGARTLTYQPGDLTASKGKFTFASAKGEVPAVKVRIDPRKQLVTLLSKKDTLSDGVPGILRNTVVLGNRGFRLDTFLDEKGRFLSTSGYRNTVFVVDGVKAVAKAPGAAVVKLTALLADPAFAYESGVTPLRLRLLHAGNVVLDKTFTLLVSGTEPFDRKTGTTTFKLKRTEKDAEVTDQLAKFVYASKTGRLAVVLKKGDLTALSPGEAHVNVELTVGDKTYFTGVTLFERKSGVYSTKGP